MDLEKIVTLKKINAWISSPETGLSIETWGGFGIGGPVG